jgi:stage III sporulation protein AD
MSLTSLCIASVIVVLIAIKLKKINPEYSTLISIGACLLIISFIVGRLSRIVGYIEKITAYIDVDAEYIAIILKMLGVAYICEFSAGICKDAGYSSMAAHIEIAGRVTMIVMSIPVLLNVIDMVVELVGG